MMDMDKIDSILEDVKYPRRLFHIGEDGDRLYLQVIAPDAIPDKSWKGRKWFLSKHMCRGEIVQTAFAAILAAEEHEIRKKFTYKGEPIFQPHFDLDALVELSKQGRTECRKPMPTPKPKRKPAGACCNNEKRNMNGGCDNCGDPCL